MTKNYVYRIPYRSKHTSYDCVFCGTSLKCCHLQMLFSFFSKILGVGSKRAKNDPKLQNDSNSISVELFFIWLWLLVHMCKLMISPAIFFFFSSFFQNYDFSGFSKFINKCQKETLRCAPRSSHVCDFLTKVRM